MQTYTWRPQRRLQRRDQFGHSDCTARPLVDATYRLPRGLDQSEITILGPSIHQLATCGMRDWTEQATGQVGGIQKSSAQYSGALVLTMADPIAIKVASSQPASGNFNRRNNQAKRVPPAKLRARLQFPGL